MKIFNFLIALILLNIGCSQVQAQFWQNLGKMFGSSTPCIKGSGNIIQKKQSLKQNINSLSISGDMIHVTIKYGSHNQLSIQADDNIIDHIKVVTAPTDTLDIDLESGNYEHITVNVVLEFKELPTQCKFYGSFDVALEVSEHIASYLNIEAQGSNKVSILCSHAKNISNLINSERKLSLITSGACNIAVNNIDFASDAHIAMHSNGASDINFRGEPSQIDIIKADLKGQSSVSAKNINTLTASLSAIGMSVCHVGTVDEKLTAHAYGSSTITYAGNPQSLEKNSGGSSNIRKES